MTYIIAVLIPLVSCTYRVEGLWDDDSIIKLKSEVVPSEPAAFHTHSSDLLR